MDATPWSVSSVERTAKRQYSPYEIALGGGGPECKLIGRRVSPVNRTLSIDIC